VLGTVGYMAPEQVRGQDVDARADLFALGAILFELVTGTRAFHAESSVETMSAILKSDPLESPRPDSAMPAALERVARHLLEKQPDERYQSARDAAYDLRALLQASTLSGPTVAAGSGRMRGIVIERIAWASMVLALAGAVTFVSRRSVTPDIAARANALREGAPELHPWSAPPHPASRAAFAGCPLEAIQGDDGLRHLYVRALEKTEFQRIAGADGAMYPFWSADGRWIGFFADGKLKRVDAAGGASPETICDAPYPRGGTWSRDGVIVMAARSGEGLVRVPASGGAPEPLPP
jgi:hypothetical protein